MLNASYFLSYMFEGKETGIYFGEIIHLLVF